MSARSPRAVTAPFVSASPSARTSPAPRTPRAVWTRRVITLVLLVGVIVAFMASDAAHGGLLWLLDRTEPVITSHPTLGALLFVGLAALSAMLAFFSSAILVPVALDAWGPVQTMALLWTGWTLGGIGAYFVGRTLGRPVVARMTPEGTLDRYEHRITANVPFGVVLLFQLAMPSEVPGYLLGMVRYPLGSFLLALALAELPFTVLTVYAGAGLIERELMLLLGAGALALLLSAATYVVLRRRLGRTDAPADPES